MVDDDILDDLFHACAFWAYLQQAALEQGPPDSEATRQRAYRLYEEALAEKHRAVLPSQAPEAATRTQENNHADNDLVQTEAAARPAFLSQES